MLQDSVRVHNQQLSEHGNANSDFNSDFNSHADSALNSSVSRSKVDEAYGSPVDSRGINLATKAAVDVCSHLYREGFLAGKLSDVSVRAFDQLYHLHRIVLVRCQFFANLFTQSVSPAGSRSNPVVDLCIHDPNVTQESLSISLALLYGAPIQNRIQTVNAKNVLACGYMLGLDSLCDYCTNLLSDSITSRSVLEVVSFLSPKSDEMVSYGKYQERLRQTCIDYLGEKVPKSMDAFKDKDGTTDLISLYSKLPFPWLKEVMETKLSFQSEFEKFQFAKRALEARKLKHESVVMVFGDENGGRIQLNRK